MQRYVLEFFVSYLTTLSNKYTVLHSKVIDERLKDVEGNGRGLNRDTIPAFAWRN
jgi:hypothetical protein